MPLKTDKNLKTYYSIKEIAEMFGVSEPTLRYWETEFPSLKPRTTANKVRQYTEKDIEELKIIYNLVKVRGFKLAAARKLISANRKNVETGALVIEKLMGIRDELQTIKKQLDGMA